MEFKLGKKEAKRDERNFKLKMLLKEGPSTLPESFDCDKNLNAKIPLKMFANDKYGCCVISGRAHHTLRFEYFEQKTAIPISDDDVLNEYWNEGDNPVSHPDNGLVLLDSLNLWRKRGWNAAGKLYNIYAFAEIDRQNHEEVKAGIVHLNGVYAGLNLPKSAQCQLRWHLRWDVTWRNDEPGTWGGHAIYVIGYDSKGPICITWGKKQKMTWDFWNRYCDECYAIVDNRNKFTPNSPVDVEKLDAFLKQIAH